MNDLKIFDNPQFGPIRTLYEDGKVLFCGNDVARALGYTNPRKALADHCKGVTKRYAPTSGGEQEMSFITEGDLYRLIVHSKLPAAEKFERWVFDEVIPSVVNHGMYATPEKLMELLQKPESIIQVLQVLHDEQTKRMELEAKIAEDAPKVKFAEDVNNASNCIMVGALAKILCEAGAKIGPNKLFERLRDDGYLMKTGERYNQPKQRFIDEGLMSTRMSTFTKPDGSTYMRVTPLITGRGVEYFVKIYT